MEALSSETELKLFYKLFADDLVVFLKHSQINRFLTKFGIVSTIFKLKLNPKKCAILAIQNHAKSLPPLLLKFQIPLLK